MTLISFLLFIVCLAVVAYVAHAVIVRFFPEPARVPALAVVGLLLLLVLLAQFVPEAANFRVWR